MLIRLPVVVAFGLMLASVCPPAAHAQGTGANWELLKMCMEAGYRPPETNITPGFYPSTSCANGPITIPQSDPDPAGCMCVNNPAPAAQASPTTGTPSSLPACSGAAAVLRHVSTFDTYNPPPTSPLVGAWGASARYPYNTSSWLSGLQGAVETTSRLTHSTAVSRQGGGSILAETGVVKAGTVPQVGVGGKYRSEVVITHDSIGYPWDDGKSYWIGFSVNPIKIPSSGAYSYLQVHHPSWAPNPTTGLTSDALMLRPIVKNGQPYYEFRVVDGAWADTNGGATKGTTPKWTSPITLNQWTDFVVNFSLSSKGQGYFHLWVNGKQVYSQTGMTNVQHLDDKGNELPLRVSQAAQIGIYGPDDRPGAVADPLTRAYFDELREAVGCNGYALVDPSKGGNGTPTSLPTKTCTASPTQTGGGTGGTPPPLASAPCGNAQAAPLSVEGAPAANDPRVVAWVDPNVKWSSYPKAYYLFQGSGQEQRDISGIPEPGWRANADQDYILMRTVDPDGTGCAIRHRSFKGQPYYVNSGTGCDKKDAAGDGACATARASILCRWGGPACHNEFGSYWAVWAVWVGPDYAGDTVRVGINTYGHSVTSANWMSLIPTTLTGDRFDLWTSSNPVLDDKQKNPKGGSALLNEVDTHQASVPATKGVWHYFVRQYKFGYLPSQNPHYRVWHAVGDGPAVKVVDTNIPNSFNESVNYHPWKFGNYQWCVTDGTNGTRDCWGPNKSRTLYTKGIYIFRDVPGPTPLNPDALLKLARSR